MRYQSLIQEALKGLEALSDRARRFRLAHRSRHRGCWYRHGRWRWDWGDRLRQGRLQRPGSARPIDCTTVEARTSQKSKHLLLELRSGPDRRGIAYTAYHLLIAVS